MRLRAALWIFGSVCVFLAQLPAQQRGQPAPVQAPSDPNAALFRVDTRLVQVDTIVRDKNGPVKGLTKDDFIVLDNGQPQPIAIFSVRKVEDAVKAPPLPPGVVANRPVYQGTEPVAATVILLDYLNTPATAQAFARLQALQYLRNSQRNEQIAIYSLNANLKVWQEFTDDRDLLSQAIERSKPETSIHATPVSGGGHGGAEMNRIMNQELQDGTVAAFATVARHLEGLPGRKKLIWIASKLPLNWQDVDSYQGDLSGTAMHAMRLVNDANVGVYPVDPSGAGEDLTDRNLSVREDTAKLTGGAVLHGSNGLAGMLDQVMQDTDLTYTLGYYRSGGELDGKYHSITVKVNRPGVEIRSRQGYDADPPRVVTEKKNRRTLNAWVQEPLEATEIGLNARATPAPGRPGFFRVEVAVNASDLHLDSKNGRWSGLFSLAVAPDSENKPKGLLQTIKVNLTDDRLRVALVNGVDVVNTVKATNDNGMLIANALHVVVMDEATGRAGSVRIPIHYTRPPGFTRPPQGRGPQQGTQFPGATFPGASGGRGR